MTDDLSAAVVAALSTAGLTVVDLTDDILTLSLADRTAALSLGNLRRILAGLDPALHAAAIQRFTRLAVVGLGSRERGVLLPRITAPGDAKSTTTPWFSPMLDGRLWLTLVEDRGEVMRYVRPMDFVRWRLSLASARQQALDNLRLHSAGVTPERVGEGIWRLATGDGLDASRLLILEQWFDEPVYALPLSRDELWLTTDARKSVGMVEALGGRVGRVAYGIVGWLVVWREGRLEVG